jgi:hypothetical protein
MKTSLVVLIISMALVAVLGAVGMLLGNASTHIGPEPPHYDRCLGDGSEFCEEDPECVWPKGELCQEYSKQYPDPKPWDNSWRLSPRK